MQKTFDTSPAFSLCQQGILRVLEAKAASNVSGGQEPDRQARAYKTLNGLRTLLAKRILNDEEACAFNLDNDAGPHAIIRNPYYMPHLTEEDLLGELNRLIDDKLIKRGDTLNHAITLEGMRETENLPSYKTVVVDICPAEPAKKYEKPKKPGPAISLSPHELKASNDFFKIKNGLKQANCATPEDYQTQKSYACIAYMGDHGHEASRPKMEGSGSAIFTQAEITANVYSTTKYGYGSHGGLDKKVENRGTWANGSHATKFVCQYAMEQGLIKPANDQVFTDKTFYLTDAGRALYEDIKVQRKEFMAHAIAATPAEKPAKPPANHRDATPKPTGHADRIQRLQDQYSEWDKN